jgi:hypothetical protein
MMGVWTGLAPVRPLTFWPLSFHLIDGRIQANFLSDPLGLRSVLGRLEGTV